MELYNLNKENLEEVNLVPFKLEKDIQALVEKNTESIFELEFIESEFRVEKYRIDTLCFDPENNSFVIVEYKKGSSYSVVDQGMTYLQLMLNNKADFLLRLSQHKGKVLEMKDVDWSQSKIIFVAESFNSYQKDSVNFDNLPFELWEIKRFTNKTIVFNKQKSNSNKPNNLTSASSAGSCPLSAPPTCPRSWATRTRTCGSGTPSACSSSARDRPLSSPRCLCPSDHQS